MGILFHNWLHWLWVLWSFMASPHFPVLPLSPIAGLHVAGERLWQRILSLPTRKQYGAEVINIEQNQDFYKMHSISLEHCDVDKGFINIRFRWRRRRGKLKENRPMLSLLFPWVYHEVIHFQRFQIRVLNWVSISIFGKLSLISILCKNPWFIRGSGQA